MLYGGGSVCANMGGTCTPNQSRDYKMGFVRAPPTTDTSVNCFWNRIYSIFCNLDLSCSNSTLWMLYFSEAISRSISDWGRLEGIWFLSDCPVLSRRGDPPPPTLCLRIYEAEIYNPPPPPPPHTHTHIHSFSLLKILFEFCSSFICVSILLIIDLANFNCSSCSEFFSFCLSPPPRPLPHPDLFVC